ncbi:MAG TPA: hypothetical protein VKD90_06745 [Gemmataceae bacterium]|nr:hypothetical protein [Gemmataceae bacterium]
MLPILLLAMGQTPTPTWTFQDEAARDGRSMLTFRAVELGDVPPRPLHSEDKPPAGSRFGDLRLGPGGAARRLVVWHAETGALWLDGDGDGRFAKRERHTLGKDPLEVRVPFPTPESRDARTVILKRRGDGLAVAVRGYMAGTVTLGGKAYPAFLTDGDADGCFDSAAADRVWIDLDTDGRFDPLTEQFPLGAPLAHGGTSYLLRPDAGGTRVAVRERPAETGTVRLTVTRLPKSEVQELNAHLVSEWGELVVVEQGDHQLPLPAGRYRIDSARLRLKGAGGEVWAYHFAGTGALVLTVDKGKETTFDLTAGTRVTVDVTTRGEVKAGDAVRVRPDIVTAAGLYLVECEATGVGGARAGPVQAAIRLTGPGSETADEVWSGFL